jgi:hypothetical protein
LPKGDAEESHVVSLTPSIQRVQLTLPLPTVRDNTTLAAEIMRVEAQRRVQVWIGRGIQPQPSGLATGAQQGTKTAVVTIAASDLSVGDYILYMRKELRGGFSEPIAMYAFSVERKSR